LYLFDEYKLLFFLAEYTEFAEKIRLKSLRLHVFARNKIFDENYTYAYCLTQKAQGSQRKVPRKYEEAQRRKH